MQRQFLRRLLPAFLMTGICIASGQHAYADPFKVGERIRVQGFGCDTQEDVRRLIPIGEPGETYKEIAAEASAKNIRCWWYHEFLTYKGVVPNSEFQDGGAQWRILRFEKDDGTQLFTPESIPVMNG